MSVKVNFIGASLLVLAQTSAAYAAPSVSTTASVIAGDESAAVGVPAVGSGYSYTDTFSSDAAPNGSADASASSDISYNTRARANVSGTASSSASAQWFETITNSTSERRRYNFTFRIDGGSIAVNGNSDIVTGQGTSGFEVLFDLTGPVGGARNIFGVSRAVGMTTTDSADVYSSATTNNYAAVIDGGVLQDAPIFTGFDSTSQNWSNSYFTIDLGELGSGESFTLAYLLRSFGNASSVADCGYGGYGYGELGRLILEGEDEGGTSCVSSGARLGDPGAFADVADLQVGLASAVVTTAVPEPAALALLGIGLAGMGAARRRRQTA